MESPVSLDGFEQIHMEPFFLTHVFSPRSLVVDIWLCHVLLPPGYTDGWASTVCSVRPPGFQTRSRHISTMGNQCTGPRGRNVGSPGKEQSQWIAQEAGWKGSPDVLRWSSWDFCSLFLMSVLNNQEAGARSNLPLYILCGLLHGALGIDTGSNYGQQFSRLFCPSPRMTYQVRGYPKIFFAVINSSLGCKAFEVNSISLWVGCDVSWLVAKVDILPAFDGNIRVPHFPVIWL